MIEFAEWLPDLLPLDNPGATVAQNVRPNAKGYLPMPAYAALSSALDARARGFLALKDTAGNVSNFAGDAAKIYELAADFTWTDKSIAGGYTTGADEFWEFAHWGNKILGVNFTDNPQQLTLGGANFSNLTTDLKARHIGIVRDFVVVGNTFDSTDGNRPNRVRWSAINDEASWTVSSATLADFQDLEGEGGWVQRVIGGEQGWIFQENSIWRMQFVGSPLVWQFDEVAPGYGTQSPASVVQVGDTIFFLGKDGFYRMDGGHITPIGQNKVDATFFADVDTGSMDRVSGVADPAAKRIFWAYPGVGSSGGNPNKILCYDWGVNRWSLIAQEVELLLASIAEGYTLDSLDSLSGSIDALVDSLDSRTYTGGTASFSAFDTDHKMGNFNGVSMAATIETGEAEITPRSRTFISGIRPLVDANIATVTVGTRKRQADAIVFGAAVAQNAQGLCPVRSNSRYHRIRVSTSGAFTGALGIDAELAQAGNR